MMGDRIRELRKRRGQSQEELAYAIGMSTNTIARWERGELTPRGSSLARLASVLNTTADYLLGKKDDTSPDRENVSVPTETSMPYTQEQVNKGMLVYILGDGKRIELPPSKESYDFLRDIALKTAGAGALA